MEPAAPAASAAPPAPDPRRLVLKNTMVLMLGQAVGQPLSMLLAFAVARLLGPAGLGEIQIATAMAGFGFLFVDWGQGPVISGAVARDRSLGGELLGTSLVWRVSAGMAMYLILALIASFETHEPGFQLVLALMALQTMMINLNAASLEAIRGHERTDVSAYQNILQPILGLAVVVPVLLFFKAGVVGALVAQDVVLGLMMIYVWRARRQVGIHPLRFRRETLKDLLKPGSSFLIFSMAQALKPLIDVKMLQYLGVPLPVIGWNAAAWRLLGPLILPASVLIGALYPTLARLHVEDRAAFTSTARSALRGTLLLSFPIALSCALFGDVGVLLLGPKFSGTEQNLVALAVFLFGLYFSMPLGTAILSAQKHRAWATVGFLAVAVGAVLDYLLIPIFQRRFGNGGLGACVSSSVGEVVMVVGGLFLVDKGTFDRAFGLSLFRCALAGAAMAGVALLFRHFHVSSLIAAPVALPAYFLALWAVGGLSSEQLGAVRGMIQRKLRRR
jgi:O-antigen/teichoic acid export membrane protein